MPLAAQPCNQDGQCPRMYACQNDLCIHELLDFSLHQIIGIIAIALISGVSSIAGLGGGGPMIGILLMSYNYTPKKSTLLIYALILGATMGNVINQATTSVKGKAMIKYRYAYVAIPFMFLGSLFGVIINKYFPNLFITVLILATTGNTLKGIYKRFKQSYAKETEDLNTNGGILYKDPQSDVQRINPLSNEILLLIAGFVFLQLLRGSEKVESIIGIERCSPTYWIVQIIIFIYILIVGKMNIQKMTEWQSKDHMLLHQRQTIKKISFQQRSREILKSSTLGGVYSGFGLGGGLFLVPMFRQLGLDQLQSTATVAFCIAVIALNNTVQSIFIGAMQFHEFIYFFFICTIGSYFVSRFLSKQFRKRNRLSYIQLLLVVLLGVSLINIPLGVLLKYISSGYDSKIFFGFGTIC